MPDSIVITVVIVIFDAWHVTLYGNRPSGLPGTTDRAAWNVKIEI
jgi:hypothetical protein